MDTQPEALRLADELDAYHTAPHHKQGAAELRRLQSVNAELLNALKYIVGTTVPMSGQQDQCWDVMKAAIAKGEQQ